MGHIGRRVVHTGFRGGPEKGDILEDLGLVMIYDMIYLTAIG
jgi:hypothetical protein